jgi:ankyrin repeat protein
MKVSLHFAVENMDFDLAVQLLDAGADPNFSDPEWSDVRPLHLAVDIECEDSCRREDDGDLNAQPNSIFTSLLVKYGASPHLPDNAGRTPLDWATERNHVQAIHLFHGLAA